MLNILHTVVQVQVDISECFPRLSLVSLATMIIQHILMNGFVFVYSSNRDVVEHRGGFPAGVKVVVGFRERARCRPVLLQEGGEIISVGGYSRIVCGNRDASDLHFFPSFRLVCLEDLVERLFSGGRRDQMLLRTTAFRAGHAYLVVTSYGERLVFQSFGGHMRQDKRNVSRDVGSRCERDRLVAVTSNGHFPARHIEVQEPGVQVSIELDGRHGTTATGRKTHTEPRGNPRTDRCRRWCRGYPQPSVEPGYPLSRQTYPPSRPLKHFRTQKGRTA